MSPGVSLSERIRQNHRKNYSAYLSNTSKKHFIISGFCWKSVARTGDEQHRRQRLRLQSLRSIELPTSDPLQIYQSAYPYTNKQASSPRRAYPCRQFNKEELIVSLYRISNFSVIGEGSTTECATLHQKLCRHARVALCGFVSLAEGVKRRGNT